MSEASKKGGIQAAIITAVVLLLVYLIPRIIVGTLGVSSPWASYAYQYSLGFITFAIGMYVILFKAKSCQPGRGNDSFWLKFLLAGFFVFAIAHAIWIYLAVSIPVKGGM